MKRPDSALVSANSLHSVPAEDQRPKINVYLRRRPVETICLNYFTKVKINYFISKKCFWRNDINYSLMMCLQGINHLEMSSVFFLVFYLGLF